MKKQFLSGIAVVLLMFCLSSCTKGESTDPLFSVRIESGWSDPEHILLYPDGLLQVYSGYYRLDRCIRNRTDCLIYSKKLPAETFAEIVETWNNLPSCRPDSLICFDGYMATFQKDGTEHTFYLSSQVNAELASFVISLREITKEL